MKTHDNTALICLSFGLMVGSILAALVIGKAYIVLSLIFGLAFAIFYISHGKEKKQP